MTTTVKKGDKWLLCIHFLQSFIFANRLIKTLSRSNVNEQYISNKLLKVCWDVVSSVELGTVGESDNYKYKISLARDNNGLYIIADKSNKDNPYLQDGTSYHFFIDTNQDNFDRDTDSQVVHFKLESGRWLKKYKDLPAHKIGKLWKFKRSELDRWVQSGKSAL